jgi:hypothetical protein
LFFFWAFFFFLSSCSLPFPSRQLTSIAICCFFVFFVFLGAILKSGILASGLSLIVVKRRQLDGRVKEKEVWHMVGMAARALCSTTSHFFTRFDFFQALMNVEAE